MEKFTDKDPETKSTDIIAENIEQLKVIFPEAFTEDKIDFEVLKQLLGDAVDEREEKYGLNWHGKRNARLIALTPSSGTLRPCPEESVDWDTTQNLMLEGDNLEVLKLLQKSYAGKIKMIYIDPPYNTGGDFIYPDDFQDNIKNYLMRTGQMESDGRVNSSNTEASGRYHTDWLNMMYPRLKLARNLLRSDGAIFISIDDREIASLKNICNEVFGEENFVGSITWEKRTKCQNTETARDQLQEKTEYILVYKREIEKLRFRLETTNQKSYELTDEKGPYREKIIEEMSALGMRGRQTMIYPILGIMPGEGKQWKFGTEQVKYFQDRGDVFKRNNKAYFKMRPQDEINETFAPFWSHFFDKDAYGTAETGKAELSEILGTKSHGYETVKPIALIKKLIYHVQNTPRTSNDDIILDFFAGSGTTGHAVLTQNALDNEKRRYIVVQLPELCEEESETYKAGFKTIAELCKERLRRAGKKIQKENPLFKGDIGFRVFKLDSSNIRAWEPDRDNLAATLDQHAEHLKVDRTEQDILFELLLKLGLDLTVPIQQKTIAGKTVHNIGAGTLLVCLATEISTAEVEPIALGIVKWYKQLAPAGETQVVFRDSGFADDVAKTNLTAILQQYGLENVRSI